LSAGASEVGVTLEDKGQLALGALFSAREREVLIAGGLLAQLRNGGNSLSLCLGQSGAADQGSPITDPIPQPLFP
jgi:hypothetical protein